jgi:hypothetical protein
MNIHYTHDATSWLNGFWARRSCDIIFKLGATGKDAASWTIIQPLKVTHFTHSNNRTECLKTDKFVA